jgi:hypothetical protein
MWRRPGDQVRLWNFAQSAQAARVPAVVTEDLLYHVPERRILQYVVTCIRKGCTIDDAGHRLERYSGRHLNSPPGMSRLYRDYPEAIARTVEIADRCTFSLADLRYQYPDELDQDQETPQQGLERLVREALPMRYAHGQPPAVDKQLAHELRLIAHLEYAPYFLTVNSIFCYARSKGILCQGRGSAANSAVCYVLGITAIDPVRSGLLFERFVSADRHEPPDIDFESERREEVIQWVFQSDCALRFRGRSSESSIPPPRLAMTRPAMAVAAPAPPRPAPDNSRLSQATRCASRPVGVEGASQAIPAIDDVLPHKLFGIVRLAALDRIDDLHMLVADPRTPDRHRRGAEANDAKQGVHVATNRLLDKRVAACMDDLPMETVIGPAVVKAFHASICETLAQRRRSLSKRPHLRQGHVLSSVTRRNTFQRLAHDQQLGDVSGLQIDDSDAGIRAPGQQAAPLERPDCLAQRAAADPEPGRQGRFSQSLARQELARHDGQFNSSYGVNVALPLGVRI